MLFLTNGLSGIRRRRVRQRPVVFPVWLRPRWIGPRDRLRKREHRPTGRRSRMIPAPFAYHRPRSLDETLGLLAQLGEDARVVAGGHSLIPMMKLRLARPEHLVDLQDLEELRGIRTEPDAVIIGAMTTRKSAEGRRLSCA